MKKATGNIIGYTLTIVCVMAVLFFMAYYPSLKKNNDEVTVSYDKLTQRDAGEVYSDWGESPTGSVKYLDGDTVLVSIFLEDMSADWNGSKKSFVYNNLKTACDYLKLEGKRYGKEVNLIYDFMLCDDLEYHMKYNQYLDPEDMNISYEDRADSRYSMLFDNANEFIVNEIPIEDIMNRYNVNSIGFLIFVDDTANKASAYSYYENGEYNHYEEMAFISLKWSSNGRDVTPDTYAHEILHLFGARDLYKTNKIAGITKDFVIYAAEEFSEDIMLGHVNDDISYNYEIKKDITKLTAYFLGWTNYIAELEKFPSVKLNKPAVFTVVNDNYGDYSEYTHKSKIQQRNEDSHNANKFILLCFLAFLCIESIISYKKRKRFKENNIYGNDNVQKTNHIENDDF